MSISTTPDAADRVKGRESPRTQIVCARDGCREHITTVARDHGDPYCSRDCAHPPAPGEPRSCSNCGDPVEGRSDKARRCIVCAKANPHARARRRAERFGEPV